MNRRNFTKILTGSIAIGVMPVLFAGENVGKSKNNDFLEWVVKFKKDIKIASYSYELTEYKNSIREYLDYVILEDNFLLGYGVRVKDAEVIVDLFSKNDSYLVLHNTPKPDTIWYEIDFSEFVADK